MQILIVPLVVGVAVLSGCATAKPPPKIAVPVAYAQSRAELGKFPAGKVVSVSRQQYDDTIAPLGRAQGSTMVVPVGKAFVPILIDAPAPSFSGLFRRKQEYYRYAVQIKGKSDLAYWDDFVDYPVGSCVALRDDPLMVVPALVQECE